MDTKRLFIAIISILIRIESAEPLMTCDLSTETHCRTKIPGCIDSPPQAIDLAAFLIKSKESVFASLDTQYELPQPPVSDVPQITELASINQWPSSLIYCQCTLGSCAANAMAFCIRYLSIRNSKNPTNLQQNPERLDPSRLYIYFNTRYLEEAAWGTNSILRDGGASIAGTLLAVDKYGCCPEIFEDDPKAPSNIFPYKGWGYDTRKFAMQPSPESYRFAYDPSFCGLNSCKEATASGNMNPYQYVARFIQYSDVFSKYKALGWLNPQQKKQLIDECQHLLKRNIPILYGFSIDHCYDHHISGFIPMPNMSTFSATSGHGVALVGYGNYNKADPGRKYFKFINSFGHTWGDSGFGYLPEEYVTNPNIFSRGGYAVDLPRVKTVLTYVKARCCPAVQSLAPEKEKTKEIVDELLQADSKKSEEAIQRQM